jgi:RNA recognition motif-containing protein
MTDFEHEQRVDEEVNSSPRSTLTDSANNTSADSGSGIQSSVKLFVGSLPYDVNEDDLLSIFNKFGEILEFAILRDRNGRSRGCAALRYTSNEAAEACIQTLHNRFCCGNVPTPLQVRHFEKREHVPVTCFIEGLPYCFTSHALWTSLSSTYGPVSNVSMDPVSSPLTAYVSFYKKSSAYALSNDARVGGVYVGGMLCPSVRVTIIKFPTLPMPIPPPIIAPGPYGYPMAYPMMAMSPMMAMVPPPVPVVVPPPPVDSPAVGEDEDEPSSGAVVPVSDPPMKLFVGCLPYSKTAQDIADLFTPFGTLIEVAILTDYSGKSRGAAFVTFSKTSEAKRALEELRGFAFPKSTRPINISFAHKQNMWPAPTSQPYVNFDKSMTATGFNYHAGYSSTCTDPQTPIGDENSHVEDNQSDIQQIVSNDSSAPIAV